MKTIVDRPYQNDYPEIVDWLLENIGNKTAPWKGHPWAAEGWDAWHTNVGKPSHIVLRVTFDRSENAALFAVRWL